jgi:hypothetical protein
MMDVLAYFKAEIDTVGRHWSDGIGGVESEIALRRPTSNMNHILWLTGHMTWAEDYLISEIPTGKVHRRKEWDSLFDHSSEKLEPHQYPLWSDVRSEWLRVHGTVVTQLLSLTQKDIIQPSAAERQWFPTAAHSIGHQVTHGHYHLGQLVYLQKLLTPVVAVETNKSSLNPSV